MATKTEVSPARQLLVFAKKQAKSVSTQDELHNLVFGIDGQMSKLIPDQAERAKFAKSKEFAEIGALIDGLPRAEVESASGFRLRLPPSVHKALVAEAEREGVSLNTLCVVKLTASLASMVGR